ncbi:YcaO-like family protein [Dyadobacter helix]|uniref:YcaO-like family protein n=1 Tax=Dyadobacter helix TaxID=2822344 RepID=UPI001BFCA763|nr:YcaO-like family protein [Dyadobacter sp. CECT 9275]
MLLLNGSVPKIFSSPVQYAILREFFGQKEVDLDLLREVYKDVYSLHEILEAFFGLSQEKVLLPGAILKIAIASPEWPRLYHDIGELGLRAILIDNQLPDLTIFIVSDLRVLTHAHLLEIKSNRFVCLWIFGSELKLSPVFDKADSASFFSFLNRMKRAFFGQILTFNHHLSPTDVPDVSPLTLLLEHLPEFISSHEASRTLLIFDYKKLDIKRIPIHESVFSSYPTERYDLLDEHGKPADVISVFNKLSFHCETFTGLIDILKSEQTPLGGWVSSGGFIYRSNKVSTETFLSRTRASGNGLTREESEAKAFCETLERYSQGFREYEDGYIIDTYKNLGNEAIHPNDILLFSPDQYRLKMARNQMNVPLLPFDENMPISWSDIHDISGTVSRKIPTFLLYLGIPPEDTSSERFFKWITNGTAAGPTPEMARLHALYELIERDAYAIWWYNRLSARGIDLGCLSHLSIVASALEAHTRLGKNVYLFDITQDICIPTVAVISDYIPGTYFLSCGSNISFEKACESAFCELNQLYLHHLNKKSRLNTGQMADIAATLASHLPQTPVWPMEKPDLSVTAELHLLETEIRKRGLDIYYKDLSRNDVWLPVVKAIVPGMRDMDTRFAAGRLYTTVSDRHGYLPSENSLRNFTIF